MNINDCKAIVFTKQKISLFQRTLIIAFLIVAISGIVNVSAVAEYIPGELYVYEDAEFGLLQENVTVVDADVFPGADDSLPAYVDLSTDVYFPPIARQIGGSCSAYSTVYYQFTYQVAKLNNWNAKENSQYRYSPKYVWNYYNNGANNGIYLEKCYEFLTQQGCLSVADFPQTERTYDWYNTENDIEKLEKLYSALQYRVCEHGNVRFAPLNTTQPVITSYNDSDLTWIKTMLNSNHCLNITTFVNSFYVETLSNGELGVLYMRGNAGYHAMTIVGYNDNIYFDLNGNGIIESYEKGALKVANSWGTGYGNSGYIWVMYDALNKVSNVSALSFDDRAPLIENNVVRYMEVDEYIPELTVEVTVNHSCRNELKITLDAVSTISAQTPKRLTFVNAIGGQLGFDGTQNFSEFQDYTFVFSYDALNLYSDSGKHYGVIIEDTSNNARKTTVKKIVWKDQNGNVIEQITPSADSNTINGGSRSYHITIGTVSLNKSTQRIQKGDTDTLGISYSPSDLYCTWESSNQKCVTVDNGVVTAVGVGTATVTVTVSSDDGGEWTDACIYTVVEGYGDSLENSAIVELDDVKNGELARIGDESWFNFTPTASDKYVLYITGNTKIRANMYNNSGTLLATASFNSASDIIAISENLIAGQTYYIKLYGSGRNFGSYSFSVAKGSALTLTLENNNPDARRVQVSTKASSVYDKLQLSVGQQTYTLTKGDSTVLQETIDNVRFKVTFVNSDSLYTIWNIDMDISSVDSLVGINQTVSVLFSNSVLEIDSETAYSNVQVSLMAYKTSFATNVNIYSGNSLELLLSQLQETGYTLSAYSQAETPISVTTTTKAATGMKILKQISGTDTIVEVFHVIVFGDLQGDGDVNSLDATIILSYSADTGTITDIQKIAGDVNHDGVANNIDAALILKYNAGLIEIEQDVGVTEVPVGIYYGSPVDF